MVNRAKRLTGLNPLAYVGVEPVSPPQFVTQDFDPTPNDWQNFDLGAIWLNTTSEGIWFLVSLARNQAKWVLIGIGGGDILTLTGNDAIAVAPDGMGNININTSNSTVEFQGNVGTFTLNQNFGQSNLILGSSASGINIALRNVGLGLGSLNALTDGLRNTGIGYESLNLLTTGSDNIALGYQAGATYTTESDNIVIGATGILGDSGVIRLGVSPTITETFVAGIYGSTVGGTNAPVFIDNTGKLGTMGGGTGDVLTLTGNDLATVSPDGAGNIDVLTTNSTAQFKNTPAASNNLVLDFGLDNLILGSFPVINTAIDNVGLGDGSLFALTDGSRNVAIGSSSLGILTTGTFNTAVGFASGSAYTTEINNITIGNSGIAADSGVIRIGDVSHTSTFISGIASVAVANTNMVTIDTTTGQLGSQAIPSGSSFVGVSIGELNDTGGIRYKTPYADGIFTTQQRFIVPTAGTFSNLYVNVDTNANTSAGTVTVNKNGVNTALVVTITALTTGIFSNLVNTITFAAGDSLDFELSQATVGNAHGVISCKFVGS